MPCLWCEKSHSNLSFLHVHVDAACMRVEMLEFFFFRVSFSLKIPGAGSPQKTASARTRTFQKHCDVHNERTTPSVEAVKRSACGCDWQFAKCSYFRFEHKSPILGLHTMYGCATEKEEKSSPCGMNSRLCAATTGAGPGYWITGRGGDLWAFTR